MLHSSWEEPPHRHAFLIDISEVWKSTSELLTEYDLSPKGIPSDKLPLLTGGVIQMGFDRLEYFNGENWTCGGYWNNEDPIKYISAEDKEYMVDEVVRQIRVKVLQGANVTRLDHTWTYKSIGMSKVLICVDDKDYVSDGD